MLPTRHPRTLLPAHFIQGKAGRKSLAYLEGSLETSSACVPEQSLQLISDEATIPTPMCLKFDHDGHFYE